MAYVFVDDPTYKGRGKPPQVLRSWAMRKLFESGMSIGDIGRYYGVPYVRAWKAVNNDKTTGYQKARVAKLRQRHQLSEGRKKDFSLMKTSALKRIATTSRNVLREHPEKEAEVAAAIEELDMREPNWIDTV